MQRAMTLKRSPLGLLLATQRWYVVQNNTAKLKLVQNRRQLPADWKKEQQKEQERPNLKTNDWTTTTWWASTANASVLEIVFGRQQTQIVIHLHTHRQTLNIWGNFLNTLLAKERFCP